jgi:citrate lyase beta subunit
MSDPRGRCLVLELVASADAVLAVLNLVEIARVDGVEGLWSRPADLAVGAGFSLFVNGEINDAALYYARMNIVMVAAVYGLATWEGAIVPNSDRC